MQVTKFFLKDVRCFEGRQEFNIRPLTFLVGENSTGKSTVLGCMQALGYAVGDSDKHFRHFDFNVKPYQMGAYADIARREGESRNANFELGFDIQTDAQEIMQVSATLVEREDGSEPIIGQLKLDFGKLAFVFKTDTTRKPTTKTSSDEELRIIPGGFSVKHSMDEGKDGQIVCTENISDAEHLLRWVGDYLFWLTIATEEKNLDAKRKKLYAALEEAAKRFLTQRQQNLSNAFHALLPPYRDIRLESFAPLRSEPRRTYDPVREINDPEGSGMPMTLMNLSYRDKTNWKSLRANLARFGKESGCFTDIQIKRHGKSMSDPFQIHITVRNLTSNIVDVGYGISQILPILVRIVRRKGTAFLIQQPEVHLHPQAQAALTNLMLDLNRSNRNSFVVETHSDAMIDRARIEIMNGRIKAENVSLIYLEPKGAQVDVHNITFNKDGSMNKVPDGYRKFFLEEGGRLLGF